MRLLVSPLCILVFACLLGQQGSEGSPPLEEGCLTPTTPTYISHYASFPAFQDRVTMDYCLASLHPSTRYEIHVSVPAWSPVTTSVSLVWRPLSPGEEGRGTPPGGRGRHVGAANHSAAPPPPSPARLLAKSGDEKLIVHGSALAPGGGTLHAVVEFHKRGSTLVLQTGVPYNIRLDPLLWGWAPQVIVQGLALPLLSSLAVTIAALWGTTLLH